MRFYLLCAQDEAERVLTEKLKMQATSASREVVADVYQHWVQKRLRTRKPLLRAFWPTTAMDDTNPHMVFRPREKASGSAPHLLFCPLCCANFRSSSGLRVWACVPVACAVSVVALFSFSTLTRAALVPTHAFGIYPHQKWEGRELMPRRAAHTVMAHFLRRE